VTIAKAVGADHPGGRTLRERIGIRGSYFETFGHPYPKFAITFATWVPMDP
jgi:hypothetical protein